MGDPLIITNIYKFKMNYNNYKLKNKKHKKYKKCKKHKISPQRPQPFKKQTSQTGTSSMVSAARSSTDPPYKILKSEAVLMTKRTVMSLVDSKLGSENRFAQISARISAIQRQEICFNTRVIASLTTWWRNNNNPRTQPTADNPTTQPTTDNPTDNRQQQHDTRHSST
jgi:hypothetical protein